MILYRIVDQNGRVYKSNRFRGFYESKASAERAMKRLPERTYKGYDRDKMRPIWEPAHYSLQEAEVTWTFSTGGIS